MEKTSTSPKENEYYQTVLDCKEKLNKLSETSRSQIDNKYLDEFDRLISSFSRLSEDVLSFLKQNSWKEYYKHLVVGTALCAENIEARIKEMLEGKDFSKPLHIDIPEHKQDDYRNDNDSAKLIRLYHSYEGRHNLETVVDDLNLSMLFFSRHRQMHSSAIYNSELWLYRPFYNGIFHFNLDLVEKCKELLQEEPISST